MASIHCRSALLAQLSRSRSTAAKRGSKVCRKISWWVTKKASVPRDAGAACAIGWPYSAKRVDQDLRMAASARTAASARRCQGLGAQRQVAEPWLSSRRTSRQALAAYVTCPAGTVRPEEHSLLQWLTFLELDAPKVHYWFDQTQMRISRRQCQYMSAERCLQCSAVACLP